MQTMYYIGLDVHKRTISYCVKDASGAISRPRHDPRHTFAGWKFVEGESNCQKAKSASKRS
jgi:hypothetical protein